MQSHRGCLKPVVNLSPTPRTFIAIILEHHIFTKINKTELQTNCDINETLRDYIVSKAQEHREINAPTSNDYREIVLNYTQLCCQRFIKSFSSISEMIVSS